MILAAHQPQYLPYLGYFEKAARADLFVFMDLPQYKKREFQNRNRIKGPGGEIWLTVPVRTKGRFEQPIREVEIDNTQDWQRSHWTSLELNYKKAPFWAALAPGLKPFYERTWTRLWDLNVQTCLHFFGLLGISTKWRLESDIGTAGESTERLIELCKKTGCGGYYSGAGGRDYMDEGRFAQEGLSLSYQRYEHPQYRQQHGKAGFLPYLSVVDLLFNEGPAAPEILRGQKAGAA